MFVLIVGVAVFSIASAPSITGSSNRGAKTPTPQDRIGDAISSARVDCMNIAPSLSAHPRAAKMGRSTGGLNTADKSQIIVKAQVEFMNGFGAMIPHTVQCVYSVEGLKRISVNAYKG